MSTHPNGTLEALINRIIATKHGNKEFCLDYNPVAHDGKFWCAAIGNKCPVVHIGEGGAELYGEGKTAIAAVEDLLHNVRQHQREN